MKKSLLYILSIVGVFTFLLFTTSFVDRPKHTSDHYEYGIRTAFNNEQWDAGKILLDEAEPFYGEIGVFYELKGWYYYHLKDYRNSRYNLFKALKEDNSNTHARTLISKVEEETGNYSTAIYYINELLENDAYDKTLWNRKITMFRKLNNDIEADRLLFRLREIYPNDTTLHYVAVERYEELYKKAKESNDNAAKLRISRHLAEIEPTADNYSVLVNNLLINGRRGEAADVAAEGAYATHSQALIKKHIGILCEQGRHYEALSFCASVPGARQYQSQVEEDLARYANQYDPYTAYGRIYEKTHNAESFNYLVNTGISRGYYDDALYYLNDYKKRGRVTEDIYYKEFVIYNRLGKTAKSIEALENLLAINPNNSDATDELSTLYYNQAVQYVNDGDYNRAIPMLQYVKRYCSYDDIVESATNKLSYCYEQLHDYDMAMAVINLEDSVYSERAAYLLAKSGRYEEALKYLNENDTIQYEELIVPYIKQLVNFRQYQTAEVLIDSALNHIHPREIYMYGVTCANALKKDKSKYINEGIKLYPFDDYFCSQYAGLQNDSALTLRKEHLYDEAMNVVNDGLYYKPDDKELLYTKGLLFENLHQYDSAHVYQKFYNPSNVESFAFKKKLEGLKMKTLKNNIAVDYQQARLGNQDILTANAGIEYGRVIDKNNSFSLSVNYAGREDAATADELLTQQAPGGMGLMFSGSYEHFFDKYNWSLGGSLSYGTKYFPMFSAKLYASKEIGNDWTLNSHLQYKRIDAYEKIGKIATDGLTESMVFDRWNHSYQNLYNLGIGANKPVGQFDFNMGADAFLIKSKPYFSVNTKVQYMPIEGNTSRVYVGAGIGSAPEITLIERSLPNSFDKLNAFVNMGGVYNLTEHLAFGLEGSWHTMYKQNELLNMSGKDMKTTYVNLFYIHTQLFLKF